MPYLLMSKSYDYDDEYYYENDGGYPELVFSDEQYVQALEQLEASRRREWLHCTPLELRYHGHELADLSSSGLDEDTLAKGISTVLGEDLSAKDVLELDFEREYLSQDQQYLIGLMLDEATQAYLEYAMAHGAA